jgi:hypothetical protein
VQCNGALGIDVKPTRSSEGAAEKVNVAQLPAIESVQPAGPGSQSGTVPKCKSARLAGLFRPPMVSVKLPKSVLVVFHFWRATKLPKFFPVKVERIAHFGSRFLLVLSCPFARVGQGSLLSGMSGVTAHDARYASLQEERARPTYQRVLSTQGRTGARAAPKSKRVKSLVAE